MPHKITPHHRSRPPHPAPAMNIDRVSALNGRVDGIENKTHGLHRRHAMVTDGKTEFKLNTWTVQALASLDFKLITFYGGVGYNNGKTTVKLKGDYLLTYDIEDSNGNYMGSVDESISDPINLSFAANGVRATLGTRLNLSIFKIFADYTFQEYNTATLGIAFSVR